MYRSQSTYMPRLQDVSLRVLLSGEKTITLAAGDLLTWWVEHKNEGRHLDRFDFAIDPGDDPLVTHVSEMWGDVPSGQFVPLLMEAVEGHVVDGVPAYAAVYWALEDVARRYCAKEIPHCPLCPLAPTCERGRLRDLL